MPGPQKEQMRHELDFHVRAIAAVFSFQDDENDMKMAVFVLKCLSLLLFGFESLSFSPEIRPIRASILFQRKFGLRRASSLSHGASLCPSCGVSLKSVRSHMAICCPDLLDPQGWIASDQVLAKPGICTVFICSRFVSLRRFCSITSDSDGSTMRGRFKPSFPTRPC